MEERTAKQIVEQLEALNKKKFKSSVNFELFWTFGYLFTIGFVPDFLTFSNKSTTILQEFWIILISFFIYPVALGEHLNNVIQHLCK